ncbi:MAG: adenylate kinase [Clostridia bacterium]|nr:adenylate kinase [Clostridia bacterium]
MIILIAGASHGGKTILAQRMLEKYKYPYLSIDHLKMGLIRSGMTDLTPEEDDELTDHLCPIVREIIKTAVENEQNLIVEGGYIPFDWRNSFDERYLQSIRFICLAMSDEYIDSHFEEIKSHGSDIETRLDDSYCTVEQLKQDNHQIIDGYQSNGEKITLITENFDDSIREVLDQHIPFCRAETLL